MSNVIPTSGVGSDSRWQRVGQQVRSRRLALRLTQFQLATAAATSEPTVRALERGRRVSYMQSTITGVCAALGWTADSIDRLLRGDQPLEVVGITGQFRPAADPEVLRRLEAIEAQLAQLLDNAPCTTPTGLDDDNNE